MRRARTAGFQTAEQRGNPRQAAKPGVNDAQSQQHKHGRENKQRPGEDATFDSVQFPADINSKLLGLRTGKNHAVTQRMKEIFIADPPFVLHKIRMHDGDM